MNEYLDNSRAESGTHWERLDALGDEGIDTSDIPALTEEGLANSKWRLPANFKKGNSAPPLVVEVAVDPDMLAWFQSQGQDYPARMRAALRLYAEAPPALTPQGKQTGRQYHGFGKPFRVSHH